MSDTKHSKSTNFPYIDRDISWMYFNRRILQEAMRKDIPLLERISFMGIYSNNLDEFFRVRMATVSHLVNLSGREMSSERKHARELFKKLTELDTHYAEEYASAMSQITKSLSETGISLIAESELSDEQKHYVKSLFRKNISGFISPVWLNKLDAFSKESDSHIYLAVELKAPDKKPDYAIIELPTSTCGRFITLPEDNGRNYVMYIDDVVRFALPMIFPGMGYTEFNAYSFKFTKDAEMEIDNDLHVGTMEKIAKAVRNRKKGAALRVLYDAHMPNEILRQIIKKLHLDTLDTIQPTGRYQNHKDLMDFPYSCRKDLKYPVWTPKVPEELRSTDSLLAKVREKDRFVQVPYQTFDYVVRLLQEAAVSKDVKSIKITLYRLSRNSKIVEALKCAARNGKRVTAVVELLARFDESSNINYAKEMQDAGINVVFGVEGLKIHSKTALISTKSRADIAIVGTGNFHEGNAKVYTDYFLMTADHRIVKEVEKVFNVIKRPYNVPKFNGLLVSPFNMRSEFEHLIENEIRNARNGKEAWIKIKINHITDEDMVRMLYQASQAGVKIELLVRGNCSVVTGVKDVSENITGAGIIDRYLEHARIFIFHAGGENRVFMGSADWMPRNLDRRIEVVTEVFDADMKADLMKTVEYGLRDNTHARIVDGSGENHMRIIPGENEPFRSQEKIYESYEK